jgi:hypothetical protein
MRADKAINLIKVGAQDTVRQYLKRLSLRDRLPVLHEMVPYVNDTPENLKFFRNHFSQEIGALIAAEYDYTRAEKIYNAAKGLK